MITFKSDLTSHFAREFKLISCRHTVLSVKGLLTEVLRGERLGCPGFPVIHVRIVTIIVFFLIL